MQKNGKSWEMEAEWDSFLWLPIHTCIYIYIFIYLYLYVYTVYIYSSYAMVSYIVILTHLLAGVHPPRIEWGSNGSIVLPQKMVL